VEPLTTLKKKTGPIEITRGEVRIGRELSTLQTLLKEWFYTCFFIGVSTIFVCQLLGIISIRMLRDVSSRRRMEDDPSIALDHGGSFRGSQDDPANGRTHYDAQDEWEDLALAPESGPPTVPDATDTPGDNDPVVEDAPDGPEPAPAVNNTLGDLDPPVANSEHEQRFRPPTPPLSAEESSNMKRLHSLNNTEGEAVLTADSTHGE
jgi:hypothetical protein